MHSGVAYVSVCHGMSRYVTVCHGSYVTVCHGMCGNAVCLHFNRFNREVFSDGMSRYVLVCTVCYGMLRYVTVCDGMLRYVSM